MYITINRLGGDKMKKLLSNFIISGLIAVVVLSACSFFMKIQTTEEKKNYRKIADSIALNESGQGLSLAFIPDSEDKDAKFKFWTYSVIKNGEKSGVLYVSIITYDKKHLTVRYPCQIQDNIIYSVGLDYAREQTFCLIEYFIMGISSFILSFSIVSCVKIIKG